MKINVYIDKPFAHKHWFFMFKRYTAVKGFIMRICGVYFNVRENNATEKLIKLFVETRKGV